MKTPINTKIKRSQRDYTMGFKLAVVAQVEKGEFTYKQAQQHYGIQGRSTVLTWLRKHGRFDWTNPIENTIMSKKTETPAQKIKRLERELSDANVKNFIYGEMVNTLKTEHGIDLEKKYLAKHSGELKKKSK